MRINYTFENLDASQEGEDRSPRVYIRLQDYDTDFTITK